MKWIILFQIVPLVSKKKAGHKNTKIENGKGAK